MTTSATLLLALAATALGASVDLRKKTADCGNHTISAETRIVMQFPNFSRKQPNNERCEWEISCPNEDDHFLEIICPKFALDLSIPCDSDRLVVTSRDQIGVFCGTNSPNGASTATGWARLNFKSNASFGAQGFRCSVWCRAKPTVPSDTTTTDASTTESCIPIPGLSEC